MTSKVAEVTTSTGTTTETTTYGYNLNGRLVSVTPPTGSKYQYAYDPDGERVEAWLGPNVLEYLLDGDSELSAIGVSSGQAVVGVENPLHLDERFLVIRSRQGYVPISDAQGSVYGLVDASGAIIEESSYGVFGEPREIHGQLRLHWGYTGRPDDTSTGLQYNRLRYLQSSTGRWNRPDPLAMVIQSRGSAYAYVENRPTTWVDPTGLVAMEGGLDSITAEAFFHPVQFVQLMRALGWLTISVGALDAATHCIDSLNDWEEFFRGDSFSRAALTTYVGFTLSSVGNVPTHEFGPGIYMSRQRDVAETYALAASRKFHLGAILQITIRTVIWDLLRAYPAVRDGVPISGEPGTQSFVPLGPAYLIFDMASTNEIVETVP